MKRLKRNILLTLIIAAAIALYFIFVIRYWTPKQAARALITQLSKEYINTERSNKIISSVKIHTFPYTSSSLNKYRNYDYNAYQLRSLESDREKENYGMMYAGSLLPFYHSDFDYAEPSAAGRYVDQNMQLQLFLEAWPEEMALGCKLALENISDYSLSSQRTIAYMSSYIIEKLGLDESYHDMIPLAQKTYEANNLAHQLAEEEKKKAEIEAQREKERHWRTSDDIPKVGMTYSEMQKTSLGAGKLEETSTYYYKHTMHYDKTYRWYKEGREIFYASTYDGIVKTAIDYRDMSIYAPYMYSGYKQPSKQTSFDPDDYDIEGYYEDNKDIYDSYEDAYDGFLDDPGEWDFYR